ncbi:hypothetical protein TRVA0_025S00298 [Trichomonascus vanleenenianus]|uniref:uncharacterized protein n=1 Tax=Trichomonascus vanleenenianus TaxID=2268995 RepID=UPI003ECA414C
MHDDKPLSVKIPEEDKFLLEVIEDPGKFLFFPQDEILTGPVNFHVWENRLTSELTKIHLGFKTFLNDGTVVCADPGRESELEENLNKLLDEAIRMTIKLSPRAMVRNKHGFVALTTLRHAFSGSAARYLFDVVKRGLAPINPDESVLQRAERFERTYHTLVQAGITLSQFFAIMATLSCNNEKLTHIIKNKGDVELEADNLLKLTSEINQVYPEVFVDEDRENAFEARENKLRARKSHRYRPRDATHRCTRCGFIGHRSTFCKIDWDVIQKYRNTRNKDDRVYTRTNILFK